MFDPTSLRSEEKVSRTPALLQDTSSICKPGKWVYPFPAMLQVRLGGHHRHLGVGVEVEGGSKEV